SIGRSACSDTRRRARRKIARPWVRRDRLPGLETDSSSRHEQSSRASFPMVLQPSLPIRRRRRRERWQREFSWFVQILQVEKSARDQCSYARQSVGSESLPATNVLHINPLTNASPVNGQNSKSEILICTTTQSNRRNTRPTPDHFGLGGS